MKIKKIFIALIFMIGMSISQISPSLAYKDYKFNEGGKQLYTAYIDELAKNTTDNDALETNLLNQAEQYSNLDYAVMKNIGKKWNELFSKNWKRYTFKWDKNVHNATADELKTSDIKDSEKHAFVCLGFQLKDGEMLDELKGRCETVAAAARLYPKTKIYVSGGATGPNNPDQHTEADLMKEYLVNVCHIDEKRIFTDPRAMTTVQNAENTFDMLKRDKIESITIVTSGYHTRRGTLLYYAESQMYEQGRGYKCDIIGNLGYYLEKDGKEKPLEPALHAARSLKQILGLPQTTTTEVTVKNNQMIYSEGDKLDLTITATKLGKKTEIKDYKVSGYDSKTAGRQVIKVTYKVDGKEQTSEVEVFVKYKFLTDEQVFDKTHPKDIVIKTNGALEKLTGVYLDNKILDKKSYTLAKGSTILTLKKELLSKLSNGKHTVKLVYGKEDKLDMEIVIAPNAAKAREEQKKIDAKKGKTSQTQDNTKAPGKTDTSDHTSIIAVMIALLSSLAAIFILKKRVN
ncbi:MAG: ElyC/SanA/YdcF family protein [Eggerthia catenaformis]|uniref:ElyC/SanA/YdcF family protein n=1 Tax=Eggerthia catenaformis TaxID=31973 RepID=UPI000685700C|nr:ElyC/SanA/YdcF family protein [Eggerthia catenaformis]